jgi:hypothetical protein
MNKELWAIALEAIVTLRLLQVTPMPPTRARAAVIESNHIAHTYASHISCVLAYSSR